MGIRPRLVARLHLEHIDGLATVQPGAPHDPFGGAGIAVERLQRLAATSAVAQHLHDVGCALGGRRVHAAVLAADLRGFTSLVE
jgi:hypothetical protein